MDREMGTTYWLGPGVPKMRQPLGPGTSPTCTTTFRFSGIRNWLGDSRIGTRLNAFVEMMLEYKVTSGEKEQSAKVLADHGHMSTIAIAGFRCCE